MEKSYTDINLQLPELAPPFCPQPRELTIRRLATGDFGFTLRKGVILERHGTSESPEERQRTVIFAEPGPKQPNSVGGNLLPGDRLVEVNGVNVEGVTREAIIELIRKSGDTVRLLVQPIPELSELSMRSSAHDTAAEEESAESQPSTSTSSASRAGKVSGSLHRSGSLKYKATMVNFCTY